MVTLQFTRNAGWLGLRYMCFCSVLYTSQAWNKHSVQWDKMAVKSALWLGSQNHFIHLRWKIMSCIYPFKTLGTATSVITVLPLSYTTFKWFPMPDVRLVIDQHNLRNITCCSTSMLSTSKYVTSQGLVMLFDFKHHSCRWF